jgi:hypothetical protein
VVDLDKQKEEDGDPARSSNVVLPSAGSTIIDPTSSAETKDESKEHRDEHGNCVLCGNPEPETTSDHRQVTSGTPEWKQHVSLWLGKAVQSSKRGYPSIFICPVSPIYALSSHVSYAILDPNSIFLTNSFRPPPTTVPAYIERSALVIMLVPSVEHVDRPGELCDYSSWRGRGWCRLELAGAVLARTNVRLMLVKSATAMPDFLMPADAIHLLPGRCEFRPDIAALCCYRWCVCHFPSTSVLKPISCTNSHTSLSRASYTRARTTNRGTFTCCARDHDFGDGPGTATCDKESIGPVLSVMIAAKVRIRERYFLSFSVSICAEIN